MTWRGGALAFVFLWFLLGGLGHFVWLDAYARVVPRWAAHPREVASFTGLCDIAGAFGVLWAPTRPIAGLALIFYCLCVWTVHFDMLAHADHYPRIGAPLLWIRVLFQPALMAIIWFAAVKTPKTEPTPSST